MKKQHVTRTFKYECPITGERYFEPYGVYYPSLTKHMVAEIICLFAKELERRSVNTAKKLRDIGTELMFRNDLLTKREIVLPRDRGYVDMLKMVTIRIEQEIKEIEKSDLFGNEIIKEAFRIRSRMWVGRLKRMDDYMDGTPYKIIKTNWTVKSHI